LEAIAVSLNTITKRNGGLTIGYGQQVIDSIGYSIARYRGVNQCCDTFDVVIGNGRSNPICVMHATTIHLFLNPPGRLSLYRAQNKDNIFSLHYPLADSMKVFENDNPNYSGTIILPLQQIQFRILIPALYQNDFILFEYFDVSDLCYSKFMRAIFKNSTTWYSRYKRKTQLVKLPD
jgi:hypothetical protein